VGLYEGFGIPALEAMSLNTIPVVSSTASLPEVVGDCGVLVDPYNIEDIARGMALAVQYTLRDKEKFHAAAQKQLQKFSWERTGEAILHALYMVGGKS
ncbi:MAG TPA: glycosyltransferase, partial [Candidatus Saccharimonadia bacterium]|nr:glycosyltransferase [Candidatus Saccharimonadia bacterium]